MSSSQSTCPCGSAKQYLQCCKPFHRGTAWPDSPENLMRSRFAAFATGEIAYLIESLDPSRRNSVREQDLRDWSAGSEWLGLRIIATDDEGEAGSDEGTVEFEAHYRVRESNEEVHHHEVATFRRRDGRWFFVDGKIRGKEPIRSTEPRVGRNDPCSCGSGKKYKKCCGRG